MKMTSTALCALALLPIGAGSAVAHASWIGQHAGEFVVIHGEGSATDEAYDPKIVSSATGFDVNGAALPVTIELRQRNAALSGTDGAALLSVVYADGWWTEDAAGEWHNEPAAAYPDFRSTGEYYTYVVSYVGHTDKPAAIGHPLEIVPLTDPTKLTMGDKFDVQVLQDGKPLKGVSVTLDALTDWDLNASPTDDEGKTKLTVMNNGLNLAQYYVETETGEKTSKGEQAVLSYIARGTEE